MSASAGAASGASIRPAPTRSARRRPLAATIAGPGRRIGRYHCSYGPYHEYLEVLTANGLRFSGSGDTGQVRIADLPGHPFFPGTGSSPNYTATAPARTRSSPTSQLTVYR
jgi:CTP synthase (UTP-ammonia lyase)